MFLSVTRKKAFQNTITANSASNSDVQNNPGHADCAIKAELSNCILTINLSNSLIIHQVKTKKITTVKEVWIPGLNLHRFWRFYSSVFSSVFVLIETTYQTLETVVLWLFKHLEFCQKYSTACLIFNSLLGGWISRWNTVSRVWYITFRQQKQKCLQLHAYIDLYQSFRPQNMHRAEIGNTMLARAVPNDKNNMT